MPSITVADIHRDDACLLKDKNWLEQASEFMRRKADELKKNRDRVIAVGVSLGGVISANAISPGDSALDHVVTISMPTQLPPEHQAAHINQRVAECARQVQHTQGETDCIYGGRDSYVCPKVIETIEAANNKKIRTHRIPMMTHRSLGHHKAEISAILAKIFT